jgi:hypothetical protein
MRTITEEAREGQLCRIKAWVTMGWCTIPEDVQATHPNGMMERSSLGHWQAAACQQEQSEEPRR